MKAVSIVRIAGELLRSPGSESHPPARWPCLSQRLRVRSQPCGNAVNVDRTVGCGSRFNDVENAATPHHRFRPGYSNVAVEQGWTTCRCVDAKYNPIGPTGLPVASAVSRQRSPRQLGVSCVCFVVCFSDRYHEQQWGLNLGPKPEPRDTAGEKMFRNEGTNLIPSCKARCCYFTPRQRTTGVGSKPMNAGPGCIKFFFAHLCSYFLTGRHMGYVEVTHSINSPSGTERTRIFHALAGAILHWRQLDYSVSHSSE